jgi:hypothetical protein
MKSLDLRKLPVYWITIEPNKDRHERMEGLFNTLGFENTIQLNGELIDKANKSHGDIQYEKTHKVSDTHVVALQNKGPLIILEDDVWFTEDWNPLVTVEDDLDALYLGFSNWGMKDGTDGRNQTQIEKKRDNYYKIKGMLGIHAILYLTEEYKQVTINNFERAKNERLYCDIPVAEDLENHNILGLYPPLFYQKDGRNDEVTRRFI